MIAPRFKLVYPVTGAAPELYDLARDEGERRNVAADHPDVVARLADAYTTWFRQMDQGRGFAPNPAIVGHPAAPLFRESMIQVGEDSGLSLTVARAGCYEVELREVQQSLVPHGGAIGVDDGNQVWQVPVTPTLVHAVIHLDLPAGSVRLRPWSRGKLQRGGYVPTGADPGCRQILIRGPL